MISMRATHYHNPLLKVKTTKEMRASALFNPKVASSYYTGPQLRQAYNNTPVAVTPGSKKVKIAIIIAYTYAGLKTDLAAYWGFCFGQNTAVPNITVYTMRGATFNDGWAEEECLDVQMVCAMAPQADIYVVEARSSSSIDLMAAIDYASNTIKPDIMSMSWGFNDSPNNGQQFLYSHFSNPNVCYFAATGDAGKPSFPSTLVNVCAVGGTTLNWSPSLRQETTWSLSGSGYSTQILKPSYQQGIPNITGKFRAVPDVSAIANPTIGVLICYKGVGYIIGGTSVATPLIAGMYGNVIQNRNNNKNTKVLTTVLSNASNTENLQTTLYKKIYNNNTKNALYISCFNDIISGSKDNSNSPTIGYDLCGGLGSPNCVNLCDILKK